jgi:hypothetical protein
MEDYSKYILLKKLFQTLILERYNVDGDIRIIDFNTDEYVDVEDTKEFPIIGGFEIVYHIDLTRFHDFFDTYSYDYNEFFSSGVFESRFEQVLKYIGQLPLYHEFHFKYINGDALVKKLPEMKEKINNKLKETNETCFVSDIIWEDEHNEETKHGMTRLIVENTCGDNIKGVYIHEICSELYEDVVWLSRNY